MKYFYKQNVIQVIFICCFLLLWNQQDKQRKNMMTLTCRDMGMDCSHVIKGDSEEEVIRKAMEHGKMEHKEKMDEMNKKYSQEEMKEMMRAKINQE